MFTGIIESQGTVEKMETTGTNKTFWLHSPLSSSLKIDQSLAHDGVCLTVEACGEGWHQVTAVQETLSKTALGQWQPGTIVNLERCLQPNGRLDGHFVQGHVDTTGIFGKVEAKEGSWELSFSFPESFAALMIEKGSITVNGISLTAWNVGRSSFQVAVIPYTWAHTNLRLLQEGQAVNLEFDLIGKYINRKLELQQPTN